MPFKRIKKIAVKSLGVFRRSSQKDKDKIRIQYQRLLKYSEALKIYKDRIHFQSRRLARYARKIKSLENKYNSLLVDYLLLSSDKNPYSSIKPGSKELEKKWEDSSVKKRILFIAPMDFSGSLMRWALALTRHSDYAVRLLTFEMHPYGYDADLVFPSVNLKNWKRLLPLLSRADVVHLKDEAKLFAAGNKSTGLSKDSQLLGKIFSDENVQKKPKVFTHYGSDARRLKNTKSYRRFVGDFDARIAMTPDLNYDWFDGYFVPHAIDTDAFKYTWKDGNTIAHSPSNPEKKGTDNFLATLEDKSLQDWHLDLIQGVSHKECLKRKQKATIFFDQAGKIITKKEEIPVGFYGNSALEAMVHGIPTIAHISDEAFEGAKRAGKDWSKCPVLNPLPNDVDSMKEVIKSFSKMSHSERTKLSKKTREWTEKHHSFQSTAKELAKIYDGLV